MKNIKKVLALLLSVLLLMAVLPLGTFAAENEIVSVTVEDVTLIENTGGCKESEPEEWYYYDLSPEYLTVEFEDGSIVEGSLWEVNEQLEYYGGYYEFEQSYENQMTVGSYTIPYYYMGFETEYTVEIVETPVESITVDDVTCIEGTHGWVNETEIWEDDENFDTVGWFEYDSEPDYITVELKNGDYFEGDFWEVIEEFRDMPGFYYTYDDDQSYENQWEVGWHTATVNIMGFVEEYDVEVIENPIEEIIVDDVSLYERTNGELITEELWDGDECVGVEEWYKYNVRPEYITVILNDGEIIEGDLDEVHCEFDYPYYNYDSNQDYDNQWGVGEHTATLSFLGFETEYTVEIMETPVESVTVEDITYMVGTNGWWNEEWFEYSEPDEWYEYSVEPEYITVEFKDGEIYEGDYWEVCDELYYDGDYDSDQSYNNQWGIGTHTATLNFMGFETDYNIIIEDSPIASIEVEDLEIIEGTYSYYSDGGYYNLYSEDLEGTITFKDGTTQSVKEDVEIGDDWYYVDVNTSSQDDEDWVAGNTYEATASILGVKTTFNVTITETPIQSFVLEDVTLIENVDMEYGEYYVSPVLSEVILKDGTRGEIVDDYFVYEGEEYRVYCDEFESQYEEEWIGGNTYELTGYLLGKEATFDVTVEEDPIAEIQLVKKPDNSEALVGCSANLKGAIVRIKYTDGTYEDIVINNDFTSAYERIIYSKKIDRTGYLWLENGFEELGADEAEIELFGHTCYIPVTVKANLMEDISIREASDKSIIITVQNSDNTSYDMKVLDLCYCWIMDEGEYYASILTDKGQFSAYIYADDDSFSITMADYWDDEYFESNTIAASDWFETSYYMLWNPLVCLGFEYEIEDYNGEITADNIDQVINLAFNLNDTTRDRVVEGDEVRDIVAQYFDVDDIDLTLSEYYDEENDLYTYYDKVGGGGEIRKERPNTMSYKNGVWTATVYQTEDVVSMKLNNDLQILGYSIKTAGEELRSVGGVMYYYKDGVKSTDTGIVGCDGKAIYINKGRFLGATGVVTVGNQKMYINKGYFTGASGLVTVSGKKMYINKGFFTGASGLVTISGKKMYINKGYFTGASGLVTIGGKKMYINKGYFTGASGLVTVNGKKMYINKGYFLGKSGLVTINGKKAYVNKGYFTGATGIVTISGKKHYINKGYFTGASGTVRVGGKTYKVVKGIVK